MVGKGFSDETYGVGIKKGNTALVDQVNAALKQYVADGSWKAALRQHRRAVGLPDPEPADARRRLTGEPEPTARECGRDARRAQVQAGPGDTHSSAAT